MTWNSSQKCRRKMQREPTDLDKNFKHDVQLFHLHYCKIVILISVQGQIYLASCLAVYNLGL